MENFFCGPDLWANVLGGFVAALLAAAFFALITSCRNKQKQMIMQDLIKIMGRAIAHRNIGENREFNDEKEWIQQAKAIEDAAVAKAKKLSPTAGSLVEWLDRVPPWEVTSDVEKYVAILSKVIERIRGLMERHS